MVTLLLDAQGQLLMSDSFPGQDRSKICLSSKVQYASQPCSLTRKPAPGSFHGQQAQLKCITSRLYSEEEKVKASYECSDRCHLALSLLSPLSTTLSTWRCPRLRQRSWPATLLCSSLPHRLNLLCGHCPSFACI